MKDELLEKVTFPVDGKYVVAVSGGVDSMSLLYMLAQYDKYELIVAHADHGLRQNSDEDGQLVCEVAGQYGVRVETMKLHLNDASEDAARRARYDFLHSVYERESADGIVTAHHLDDRVETMLLNKQRGAGWIGLSPLRETPVLKRPLLAVTKRELVEYAQRYNLQWREDPTNRDRSHTPRNRIRQELNRNRRHKLYGELSIYDTQRDIREQYITGIVDKVSTQTAGGVVSIDRLQLLEYDVATARDALYMVLKQHFDACMEIDFDAVMRLEHFYKIAYPEKKLSLSNRVWARIAGDGMVIFVAA